MITPKILLHICCAPCCIPVFKLLEKKGFAITGFWYNPNIWPKEEYEKRRGALAQYGTERNFDVIFDESLAVSPEISIFNKERCLLCYEDRLVKTAKIAQDLDFDYFTTTLLVSPYQKHALIRNLGEDIGQDFRVNFFYEDFRPLFYRYRKEIKESNLYHQRYCGCKPSIKEAEETRKAQQAMRKNKTGGHKNINK